MFLSKLHLGKMDPEKFICNVKTLESLVFRSLLLGPSFFLLFEELSRYSPSYLVYFTHLTRKD